MLFSVSVSFITCRCLLHFVVLDHVQQDPLKFDSLFKCFCVLESRHPVDYQPDPQPDHGGLPAVLAAEETQQEDDP